LSWRQAPLYVAAYDLVCWLLEHQRKWPPTVLGDRLASTACALLESISLALTFPLNRRYQLREADQTAARLREQLRLAADLSLLSARQRRFAQARLAEIGRMIGGWRRSLPAATHPTGEQPPAARTG